MGYVSSHICDDMTSPRSAYERARALAVQAIKIEKQNSHYVGPSIEALSKAGQFGSWLRKLYHEEKVTIHLHFYERLVRIIEQQAAIESQKVDHLNELIRIEKGRTHALAESYLQSNSYVVEAKDEGDGV